MIEFVILGNGSTGRERSELRGHCFHFTPESGLALQELIPSGPILRTFIGKGHAH
jgi:hypothetical protein